MSHSDAAAPDPPAIITICRTKHNTYICASSNFTNVGLNVARRRKQLVMCHALLCFCLAGV